MGRSFLIAAFLLLTAATPALGAGGDDAPEIPVPREQVPGEISGFRLPFQPGLQVQVVQGWESTYSHNGTSSFAYDFGLYSGTPVQAAASGVVSFTRDGDSACGGKEMRSRGNYVTIDHPDGSATLYGHLSSVAVEVGDVVAAGDLIGHSGDSGFTSCMPHLHFARQLQGDGVTQSIPIYFQGYEDREFRTGDLVKTQSPCTWTLRKAKADKAVTDGFCASYFAGDFEGPVQFSRAEPRVAVDLADGGLGGYWLDGAQAWSARWAGRFEFGPWSYAFRIDATGGIRVKIDGVVVLEDWVDQVERRQIELRHRMDLGIHSIEIEHFSTHPTDHMSVEWSPESDRRTVVSLG